MFIITSVFLAGVVSAGPAITFEPVALSLQEGSSVQVTLMLDEAPLGLAGYDCSVVSSSPSTVSVTSATFPSWATLNSAKETASGLLIQATDTGKKVQNSSVRVELVTVTLQATSPGTAIVSLFGTHFSADGGSAITPMLGTLAVTVPGSETGSGSSSSSSSYSSYSSSDSNPTSTLTSVPTTVPTVVPTTIITSDAAVQVTKPLTTQTTSEPVTSVATAVNPTPVPSASAGTLTTGVAIGVLVLALMGSRKRRDN